MGGILGEKVVKAAKMVIFALKITTFKVEMLKMPLFQKSYSYSRRPEILLNNLELYADILSKEPLLQAHK